MVNPVPGRAVTTKYGVRGQHWSCQKTSAGGIHTGLDIAAPLGTKIVAPIAGTIRHRNYGKAFGGKQFAISPSKGQPFADGEVFIAHTRTRLKDGTEVKVGQFIAEVGAEGNVTGPHPHIEFMPNTKGQWRCGIHSDPQKIIDWNPNPEPPDLGIAPGPVYASKLAAGQMDSDSVSRLQQTLNGIKLAGGVNIQINSDWPKTGETTAEVKKWQLQKATDPSVIDGSRVTLAQAKQLFAGTGNNLVDDLAPVPTPPKPEAPVSNIVYWYSGKPAKTQTIGASYTMLTGSRWTSPGKGWVILAVYANTSFKKGIEGGFRIRAVRENPTDETAYQDYTVGKKLVVPGSFLISHNWPLAAQKGRPFRWDLRKEKGMGTVTAGTRYAKALWISDVAARQLVGRAMTPPQPKPRGIHLLLLWLRAIFSDSARKAWLDRNKPRRLRITKKRLLKALAASPETSGLLARVRSSKDEGTTPILLTTDAGNNGFIRQINLDQR